MPTYEEIKAEFSRVNLLVDNVRIELVPTPLPEGAASYLNVIKEMIARLLDKSSHLPQVSGYDWVLSPECELNPYELVLQHLIIGILSEISSDHPDLIGFKPTVVRLVRGASFSSVAIPGDSVNFICISFGFMKFIQAIFGLILDLREIGKEKSQGGVVCATNLFFGRDVEAALRAETHAEIARIIFSDPDGGVHFTGFGSPINNRLSKDEVTQTSLLPEGYFAAEAFIVCHELGHLLNRDQLSLGRDSSQERQADAAAMSLLLCASALGIPHQRLPIIGPPVFFQIARLYELIRRFREAISNPEKITAEALQPDRELLVRLVGTAYGLEKFVDKPTADRSTEIAAELSVVIAGFQQCMMRFVGIDAPLDYFL